MTEITTTTSCLTTVGIVTLETRLRVIVARITSVTGWAHITVKCAHVIVVIVPILACGGSCHRCSRAFKTYTTRGTLVDI